MPQAHRQDACATKTLEDLVAGVKVVERAPDPAGEPEELYATDVDWYAAMRVRQLRGVILGVEVLGRMARIREENQAYRMLKDSIETRARLALAQ